MDVSLQTLFFLFLTVSARYEPPKPSSDILAWTEMEMGAFYSFNMITMLTSQPNTQFFCIGVGGQGGLLPSPNFFNPEQLDLDSWLQVTAKSNAKYAILTATHCSGFAMWPSDIQNDTGFEYQYSTKYSSFRGGSYDVVRDFVNSCRKFGIRPGIYYSLNQNYYLNIAGGQVQNTPLVPGQQKVSQELYNKIALAQLKELWTNYGSLFEVWFDGGCGLGDATCAEINQMRSTLQTHAVAFEFSGGVNGIRWVGTESGMPSYPIWSTSMDCTDGSGDPYGNTFCPAETDTTLQEDDHWFWRSSFPIRSLFELQQVYFSSVGQNTNLLLNMAANSSGLVDDSHVQRLSEFGEWIRECFGTARLHTSGTGYKFQLISAAIQPIRFNRVVIQEDQTSGEAVQQFTVSYNTSGRLNVTLFSGESIGHKLVFNVTGGVQTGYEFLLDITNATYTPVISFFGIYYCKDS